MQQLNDLTTVTTVDAESSLPLPAGRWVADPNSSGLYFVVRHLGLTNVRGRFNRFDATLDIGPTLADLRVLVDVDLSSVDTNNADRDRHLRTSDFFDVQTHPTMTFRSTSADGDGDTWSLVGDLTIGGVTRSVTLDVEFDGTEVFPADQSLRAGFSAAGQIRRSDFGIDFGLGADKVLIGDKVKIDLDVQFIASHDA